MKRSLIRPTDALFPLFCLAAGLIGEIAAPLMLCLFYYLFQILSLCAVDCFRNAAAREPGVRRVDKRFGGGLMQLMLAFVLYGAALLIGARHGAEVQEVLAMSVAAGCVLIEQMFEERMHAIGKPMDVVLMSIISGVLLMAGMVMDALWENSIALLGMFTMCGAALGAVVAAVASLISEPVRAFSLLPRNYGFSPKACAQTLLFPAAGGAVLLMQAQRGDLYIRALEEYMFMPLLIGLVFWRLFRTVCRRTADESRKMNLVLVAAAAAAVLAKLLLPELVTGFGEAEILHITADIMCVLLICEIMVFCAPGWRLYAGAALVCLAGYMNNLNLPSAGMETACLAAACVFCAAAVVLNLHRAFLKKV